MRDEINKLFVRIEEVKRECGITREITVVAATKTVSPERINELPKYGIKIAGENRVQELLDKYDEANGLEWHFIGALQTNKVKYIIDKVSLIHSVDREALADEIDRQAEKRGIIANVLVEINVGGETSKSGVSPDRAKSLIDYVAAKKRVRLKGIMSVLPINATNEQYAKLAEFGKYALEKYGADVISAGMSGDYEKAIRYGANMIRPGSAIFGKRNYTEIRKNG